MSNAKNRRRPQRPDGDRARPRAEELASARRRAVTAKGALVIAGAALFTVAMGLAQRSYAGHAKDPVTALSAPPKFLKIVKKNLLQAGIVGPAQAPPGAATAAS